jgi:uncharacterized protein YrrD
MDLGAPDSYIDLKPGVPVYSSDGDRLGKVERVRAAVDLDIFDGIVIDRGHRHGGQRYVDAAQVREIFEQGVELTISSDEADRLPEPDAG